MLHIQWRVRNRNRLPTLLAQAPVVPETPRNPRNPASSAMDEDRAAASPQDPSTTVTISISPLEGPQRMFSIRFTLDTTVQPRVITFLQAQETITLVAKCTRGPPTGEPLGTQGTVTRTMRLLQITPGVIHGQEVPHLTPRPPPNPPRRRRLDFHLPPPYPWHPAISPPPRRRIRMPLQDWWHNQ